MSGGCACLCTTIRDLAQNPDETRATALVPSLNRHLGDLQSVLAHSRAVSREVQFRITPSNERTERAFFVETLDLQPVNTIYELSKENTVWFWTLQDNYGGNDSRLVHAALQHRLACVVVFLRSVLDIRAPVPSSIVGVLQGKSNYSDIRNAGRKYLKISRKLGGLGSIFWLPTSIPHTTYERYLHINDERVFGHLKTIGPEQDCHYAKCAQRLIMHHLVDSLPSFSYCNLITEYAEVIPESSVLLLLIYALRGSNVPDIVLTSIRFPQRRWNINGEIDSTTATDFGLATELVNLLCSDEVLRDALDNSNIMKQMTKDEIVLWSVSQSMRDTMDVHLLPTTKEYLGTEALKLMCFICPPCLEGNLDWSTSLKLLVWPVFQQTVVTYRVPPFLRSQVIESLLYFAERDSVPTRQAAVDLAKSFLRKSMPYYLHASVVLFDSTLLRVDAEFVKSEAQIRDFTLKGPKSVTRRDHALLGRLHISHVENKIKMYDTDVGSCIYNWEAGQPRSTLDTEVTFRLQSTAARYFQSVGDFKAARASLTQFLSLDTSKPIRSNSRRLLVGRLADVCCEMQEYEEALSLLQAEIERSTVPDRSRRWFIRLLLAQVEANIGLGRMDIADAILKELASTAPCELNDIHDEQLYMRRLVASARLTHVRSSPSEVITHWKATLQESERMHTLSGFVTAVIHLSLAHAQLLIGDRDNGRRSWAVGLDILKRNTCEYWLPTVSTLWIRWIAEHVHRLQGWGFRMMQPGGRPDVILP